MLDGVEGVEVEPLMLEGSPPRLDHRVRFGDLDLGENAVEAFGQEDSVDGGVDVLDAGVGHDRDRWSLFGGNENGREDLADALGVEAEGAQGHVAVLGSENHVFDGGDLGGRELAGHGSRTWGTIVEPQGMATRFQAW